tara:strand:+ start:1945 stop:3156 length:1212 start_codon:yes stop_codon:yes gene_type:complete
MNKNNYKNLLLVGPYPPPFGGVSSHLYELKNSLQDKFNFHILQFDSTEEILDEKKAVIRKQNSVFKFFFIAIIIKYFFRVLKVLSFLLLNFYLDPRFYLSSLVKTFHVVDFLDKFKIDKLIVYTTRIGSLITFVKILKPNLEIYYCIYADPFKNPKFYKKHNLIYKKAVLSCRKVFSSSCYCSSGYGKITNNVDPSVIYIGVDLERFKPMDSIMSRIKLNIPEKPTILFLGRMEPEMGVENAMEIAKKLTSKNSEINFVIAGAEGSLTESLIESASFSKNIIVSPNVSKDDLPFYYGASSIVIAPTISIHACMGVSIKEAMASARPVIASSSGGIPEAIRNNIDGYIIEDINNNIDCDSFVEKIEDIINDQAKLKNLGFNARVRCEEIFSVSQTAKKYLELLN